MYISLSIEYNKESKMYYLFESRLDSLFTMVNHFEITRSHSFTALLNIIDEKTAKTIKHGWFKVTTYTNPNHEKVLVRVVFKMNVVKFEEHFHNLINWVLMM